MTELQAAASKRRQVRKALRSAREVAGLSRQQAADAMRWSLSKMARLEDGRGALKASDVLALLAYFETPKSERDLLVDIARSVQNQPAPDRDALSRTFKRDYITFLELEQEAMVERQWHPYVVPGLLQTEAYAEMITREMTWLPREQASRVRQSRMARQQILAAGRGPRLSFLVDESVFRRAVRPKRVMRDQIMRIIELTSSGSVDARVVPFLRGPHAGLHHSFVLLEFEDPSFDVIFMEGLSGADLLRDDRELITRYVSLWDDLSEGALHGPRLWRWLEGLSGSL